MLRKSRGDKYCCVFLMTPESEKVSFDVIGFVLNDKKNTSVKDCFPGLFPGKIAATVFSLKIEFKALEVVPVEAVRLFSFTTNKINDFKATFAISCKNGDHFTYCIVVKFNL